jgi:hypothetical protein
MDFGLLGWVEAVEGNIEGEAATLGSQPVATGSLHCGQWEEIEGVEPPSPGRVAGRPSDASARQEGGQRGRRLPQRAVGWRVLH